MITREDYLNALELIDQYHRQQMPKPVDIKKTPIQNLLSKDMSGRLYHLLFHYPWAENGATPFEYIEDINKREFFRLRNAGKKGWEELQTILNT